MFELAEDHGLLAKLCPELCQSIGGQAGLRHQLLEGHGLLQSQVPRPVDSAHPTRAEERGNAIAVLQHLSSGQSHSVVLQRLQAP